MQKWREIITKSRDLLRQLLIWDVVCKVSFLFCLRFHDVHDVSRTKYIQQKTYKSVSRYETATFTLFHSNITFCLFTILSTLSKCSIANNFRGIINLRLSCIVQGKYFWLSVFIPQLSKTTFAPHYGTKLLSISTT